MRIFYEIKLDCERLLNIPFMCEFYRLNHFVKISKTKEELTNALEQFFKTSKYFEKRETDKLIGIHLKNFEGASFAHININL